MPKLDLTNVTSGFVSTTLINANNALIETAVEKTLSRDGTSPNQMESTLDMNGNLIINQANPVTVAGFNWEGPWTTGLVYQVGDVIQNNNSSYICIVEHTAGVFATDLAAGKWQLVASSAALPTQSGQANKYLTTDGSTASWGGVISDFAETFLDDADAASVRTTLGVASTASPALTGIPTAPTPLQFDNSTKIATTEFVQTSGLHYKITQGAVAIIANTVLLPAQMGHWFEIRAAGLTITLPALSDLTMGCTYTFVSPYAFTLKASGVETINNGTSNANTYSVLAGQSLIVTSNGVNDRWHVTSQGFGATSFTSSQTTSGYQKLPGGLIIQWGRSTDLGDWPAGFSNKVDLAFPTPFLSAVFGVFPSLVSATGQSLNGVVNWDTSATTLSQARFGYAEWGAYIQTTNYVQYIAIGV